MLLTQATLDAIRDGSVSLVFRRWKRPTVKAGGTLRTAIGMLEIHSLDRVSMRSITAEEAARAGHPSRAALLDELRAREGDVYRIEVALGGSDPLIDLREASDLDDADLAVLRSKLGGLDARSSRGAWTRTFLELIERAPSVRAADLAAEIGIERDVLKADVRKLKRLGLTISESPGYRLSPRGETVLARIRAEAD